VAALGAVGALAASCSIVTDLTSLGGGDASVSDAPSGDAPAGDAQPTDSGASCPGYPLAFACDDFHDGFAPFWEASVYGGGSLSPSAAAFVSPPLALLAETPNAPDSGGGPLEYGASLEYDRIGVATQHVRSSYNLYLDELGDRSAAIGGVYLGTSPPSQTYGVVLYVNAITNALIEDGLNDQADGASTANSIASGFALPTQKWTRIVLDVDFAAGTASLAATDPATPPDAALPYLVPPTPIHATLAGPSTFVYAGISYQVASPGQINATRVYVDDVVFESL